MGAVVVTVSRAAGGEATARFLADASRRLVSSLDWEKTLASVADLAAQLIADWFTAYLVEDDGSIRRLAITHADRKLSERCWEVVSRFPMDKDLPHGTARVLRTGEPVVISEITDAMMVEQARDATHLEWLRSTGIRSLMSVPLLAHGRTLGALTFISRTPSRYGPEDVALAADFARLAGLAIDNARLYRARVADEERLRAILDHMPALVYLKDGSGRVTLGNRRYQEQPEVAASLAGRELEALGHRRLVEAELVVDGADGPTIYQTCSFPLLGADGVPYAVSSVLHDVSERRRLEAQLREAQVVASAKEKLEAIGLLAAGIAHDFNNILTVIKGYGELLANHLRGHRNLRAWSQNILRSASRAASLTGQLLAFGRQQVLELEVLDLNAIVSRMAEMLQRTIGEDIVLVTRLESGIPAIRADAGQVERVIINLALNARDAMPRGGRLTVTTAAVVSPPGVPAGHYTTLTVCDEGEGMNLATQARIFEPFFTTKPRGRGTGLGLATVYGIVQQAEGQVLVESAPGRGTTFTIHFPSIDDAGPRALPPAPAPGMPSRAKGTILVVEDDDDVRLLVGDSLEARGYTILAAADGSAAVRLGREHVGPIDLLVTDVVMPGMSGPEVARELGAERPGLKVLYLSGYAGDALERFPGARPPRPEPGLAFLRKPFTLDGLASRIDTLLDAPA